MMSLFGYTFLGAIFWIAGFFIAAAILMATWNYCVPRLAYSVDSSYSMANKFTSLDYTTSMVTIFLFASVFGTLQLTTMMHTLSGAVHDMELFGGKPKETRSESSKRR